MAEDVTQWFVVRNVGEPVSVPVVTEHSECDRGDIVSRWPSRP